MKPVDAALAKQGAEIARQRRCGSCHLPNLTGSEQMPRLAKQRIDYLIAALKEFRDTTAPGRRYGDERQSRRRDRRRSCRARALRASL